MFLEPFTRIPFLLAHPIPPKKLNGIEITRAQGQLITKNVRALKIQSPTWAGCFIIVKTIGGIIAKASAL